jgi:hypothetical protein
MLSTTSAASCSLLRWLRWIASHLLIAGSQCKGVDPGGLALVADFVDPSVLQYLYATEIEFGA